ncbi:DUF4919 domain-containing protein [Hymenobacter aerophilus]|uniref:DUF4919 domain-containing protein n=1 Tax=Hymenobacter aerophilus TaxID=119644 RepID=UPI00146B9BF2|nr:DUF4919 domain-containing protein [Hymenobacter aerophilus]
MAAGTNAQSAFDYAVDYPRIVAQSSDPKSTNYYPALRKRFVANDPKLTSNELLALQIGHTRQPAYHPYADIDVERGLYDLNAGGHFTAALELAASYQRRNPLSLMLNLEKAYALSKAGQADSAAIYLNNYKRLMETLLASGDGDKKPYFVLSPIDGQILITRFWQGELGVMGSSFDKKGNMLDMLEMKSKSKEKTKVYLFNIQHARVTMLK